LRHGDRRVGWHCKALVGLAALGLSVRPRRLRFRTHQPQLMRHRSPRVPQPASSASNPTAYATSGPDIRARADQPPAINRLLSTTTRRKEASTTPPSRCRLPFAGGARSATRPPSSAARSWAVKGGPSGPSAASRAAAPLTVRRSEATRAGAAPTAAATAAIMPTPAPRTPRRATTPRTMSA